MFTIHESAMQLLVPLYNGPDRHYHNINHIYYCINKLQEYEYHTVDNPDLITAVTYAIWFHDAIYSPYPVPPKDNYLNGPHSNEVKSVELFYSWITTAMNKINKIDHIGNDQHAGPWIKLDGNKIFSSVVDTAIKNTEFHLYDLDNIERPTQVMLDCDLVGLAKPLSLVLKDGDNIFKEYECTGITREQYDINRREFLSKLLNRKSILYTDYFHETYEKQLRDNLEAIIELT